MQKQIAMSFQFPVLVQFFFIFMYIFFFFALIIFIYLFFFKGVELVKNYGTKLTFPPGESASFPEFSANSFALRDETTDKNCQLILFHIYIYLFLFFFFFHTCIIIIYQYYIHICNNCILKYIRNV